MLNNKLGIIDAQELAPEEEHLTKKRIRYIGEREVDLIPNKEYTVLSIEHGWYRIVDEPKFLSITKSLVNKGLLIYA